MDGVSLARKLYGRRIRAFRSSAGMSQQALATAALCTKGYVSEIENGLKLPDQAIADSLDTALAAGGELMADWRLLDTARRQRPRLDTTEMSRGDEEDDVERRLLLQRALGVTAAAGVAGPLEGLEAIRHTLDDVVGDRRSVEEWEQLAWDYGHDLLAMPASELIDQLGTDVLALRRLLGRITNEHERAGLQRVAAQLSLFVGDGLQDAGEQAAAFRWYRTAETAADHSGDHELRVSIRGRQATAMTFTAPHKAVAVADRALAIANDHNAAGAGYVKALQGRAQALSVLDHPQAAETVDMLCDACNQLPGTVASGWRSDWTETSLYYVQSLVYARSGDSRAVKAQDAALPQLPQSGRGYPKIRLHRAGWLVRTGDPSEGLRQAIRVLQALPPQWRVRDVLNHARDVERALPAGADSTRAAVEFRELLALPSGN